MRPRTLQGRLTVLFALGTILLAGVFGIVVLAEFRSELDTALDEGLRDRFSVLQAQVTQTPNNRIAEAVALPRGESFAQVLRSDGTILAASPRALDDQPIVPSATLRRAARHRVTLVRTVEDIDQRARLLVGPAGSGRPDIVLVVGTRLAESERAGNRLEAVLAVGLPVLSALVALGGWLLTGAALKPVRSMIEEADELSGREPRRRLTVPGSGGAEVAELARRLNALLGRIESAVAHERAFLDDASHELRTPLAILRGEVELARMTTPAGTDTAVALDSVLEEVTRLERLTGDLLVLARTRALRPTERTAVDVGEIAARAATAVRRARGDDAVEIATAGSAWAVVDEQAIERAITNLLDNACRHARSRVEVQVEAVGPDAVLEVSDDGDGFPAELLGRRAFERFAHGAGSSGREGAGLGLAIVDAIVAAHGGDVVAENRAEGGARVRVSLPGVRAAVRA